MIKPESEFSNQERPVEPDFVPAEVLAAFAKRVGHVVEKADGVFRVVSCNGDNAIGRIDRAIDEKIGIARTARFFKRKNGDWQLVCEPQIDPSKEAEIAHKVQKLGTISWSEIRPHGFVLSRQMISAEKRSGRGSQAANGS